MSRVFKSDDGRRAVEASYRAFLDRWPVAHEELRVPTREGETFVVACGPADAPPVLLFQGAQSNAAGWLAVTDVAALAAQHRLYFVDVIGEPGLSAPSRPPLDSDAHALWLDDVFAGLGVGQAAIVGMSLGGWLGLDYAIRRPERVERLAVFCPAGVGRQRPGFFLVALALLMLGPWGRTRLRRMVFGAPPPDPSPEQQELIDFFRLLQRHSAPRVEKLHVFSDEALSRLTMPVLAILGDKDPILDSAETRRRLERAAPHAQVRWLTGVGHVIVGQTEAIGTFLEEGLIV